MPDLTLAQIRHRFGGLPLTSYKQRGLRAVRDGLALGDRNEARTRELHEIAAGELAYAIALEDRTAWRKANGVAS